MASSHVLGRGGRSRRGRLVALLSATAVAASLLSAPSGQAPAAAGPAAAIGADAGLAWLPDGAEPVAVTLITGDTVLWHDIGDGNARMEVEPADRDYPVDFDESGTQEDFYVIPTDMMEHVVSGGLDRELFNIPSLIRQGLDDDSTGGQLPVIVTFDETGARRAPAASVDADALAVRAEALPATADAVGVERVHGAGVTIDRSRAARFRDAVLTAAGSGPSAASQGMAAGVEKILLDQMLEIDLDGSVPQIGAPEAWDAGYTGEGVRVAVLDTGVDASHPDLAGQVVAAENFVDGGDPIDDHGHGTHVASTMVGLGAASDGQYTGVAPDADLLSGKVCAVDGQCPASAIMAGMEWAAAQGAEVVNMSLGGAPTDGSDPLSQLVNQLSAETGTLFVTSAGNNGAGFGKVGSPAAADAALAVAAVDKSDRRANFSARGPRIVDHAFKPEITAPGVGIVAARADGTGIGNPVNDDYTSLQGTSMASPHVAGAAALLAQARPDLEGRELKDALVSTATDVGEWWTEQGTGRVDIPAALDSPVHAQAAVNFGGVDGPAAQDLTYTNHSEQDITLSLQAVVTDTWNRPTDAAAVSLSVDTLTVPAGGQATVTVTVNPAGELGDPLGGVITAAGPGDIALRTGIGFGPPLHEVTVEVLDSNGDRIGTDTAREEEVKLSHDTFDPEIGDTPVYEFFTVDGIATAHVPAGTYTILTDVRENEPDAGTLEFTRGSLLVEVEIDIQSDTALTLDAREAVPVEVTVPRKTDKRMHQVSVIRELAAGSRRLSLEVDGGGFSWPMYVTPAPPGDLAPLRLFVGWTLAEPQPVQPLFNGDLCPALPTQCYSDAPAYVYNLPFVYENGIPNNLHERVTRRDLVEVPTRYHSDHPDAFIMHQFESLLPLTHFSNNAGVGAQVRMWFRPGKVTEFFLADDRITWNRASRLERRPEGGERFALNNWSEDRFTAAEAGARRSEESWFAAPVHMGTRDNRDEFLGNPIELEMQATPSRGGPDGDLFGPGIYMMDNARGHGPRTPEWATWRMWNLDTGSELDGGPVFTLASEEATYRLEQVEEYPASVEGVFRTGRATTTWTFTSTPSDAPGPHGYRCPLAPVEVCQIQPLIQLEYGLGLDVNNRAPAGRAHVFTITAGHHSKAIDNAPVTSMTVQASFDDGDTWQDARVIGKPKDTWDAGGFLPSAEPYQQFRVVLKHPPLHRTNGYVTLRVQAQDANGGTIEQAIPRAYILR